MPSQKAAIQCDHGDRIYTRERQPNYLVRIKLARPAEAAAEAHAAGEIAQATVSPAAWHGH